MRYTICHETKHPLLFPHRARRDSHLRAPRGYFRALGNTIFLLDAENTSRPVARMRGKQMSGGGGRLCYQKTGPARPPIPRRFGGGDGETTGLSQPCDSRFIFPLRQFLEGRLKTNIFFVLERVLYAPLKVVHTSGRNLPAPQKGIDLPLL